MGWFFGRKKETPKRKAPHIGRRRNYSAALTDRVTNSWTTQNRTAAAELHYALRTIRARSRDLARNNDYARHFFGMVASNVIGPNGIKLQVRSRDLNGRLDKLANDEIERHWSEWSKLGICTVDGQLDWVDAQRLFITSTARDGEILARKIKGRNAGNAYGFAIQFLEADHLDEDYSERLPNGNRIEMSIERTAFGRPVAYHLLNEHPGAETYSHGGRKYSRVPASEILHSYLMERVSQPRGIPWMVSAMLRLQMLGGYEEAEVIAARIAASKMGFFTSQTGDGYAGDDEDDDGNLVMDVSPGVLEQLPQGLSFQAFDPKHPPTGFDVFVKAILRGVAAGIGVSYNGLANDLEGVNYSSIRHGTLEERDNWRSIQSWTVSHFCQPIYEEFLLGLLSGTNTKLPPRRFDKFNAAVWRPRGWQWIDPLKEVQANREAVDAGFKSRTDVLGETGRDFEETLDQLAAEAEIAAAAGVSLNQGNNSDEIGDDENAEADANSDD